MLVVVQDGAAAGQTIPHVHIHCVPRHFKDLEHNDQIYDRIDEADAQELRLRQRCASGRFQHGAPDAVRFGGGVVGVGIGRAERGAVSARPPFWRRGERAVPSLGFNDGAGACREPLGNVDIERQARTGDEMAAEASRFRALMSAASAHAQR